MSLDDEVEDLLQETSEQAINRLAKLSLVQYEERREKEAKTLKFRASALDKMVAAARKEDDALNDDVVTSDKPYDGTVNGVELLDEIASLITKHVILPKGALAAITVWIAATFVYNAFRVFPKLAIISPEKRCGKTTLLDILASLCCRALIASNITPSAIFRSVELWRPSLIIDEADTFLSGRNDDLIGIVNSGHTRSTAFVIRTVGDEHIPQRFSTWAPMAFASIKGIVGTVMDRSIIIPLRRKTVNEKVKRLPIDFKADCDTLRQKLTAWAEENFDELKGNPIEPPEIPNDRAIDNWLPLFTIAHVVGGEWPEKVELAYIILNSREEEETAAIMLLRDIKAIFDATDWVKVHSATLVHELIALEERPWNEWKKGQPMTQNSLAKILKTFSISSKDVRTGIPEANKRGYRKEQFNEAFERYIPDTAIQSAAVLQASNVEGCSVIQSATNKNNVALLNRAKPSDIKGCSTVALENNKSKEVMRDEGVF